MNEQLLATIKDQQSHMSTMSHMNSVSAKKLASQDRFQRGGQGRHLVHMAANVATDHNNKPSGPRVASHMSAAPPVHGVYETHVMPGSVTPGSYRTPNTPYQPNHSEDPINQGVVAMGRRNNYSASRFATPNAQRNMQRTAPIDRKYDGAVADSVDVLNMPVKSSFTRQKSKQVPMHHLRMRAVQGV